MRRLLTLGVVLAAMAMGAMALASPAIQGKHAGKKTKDGKDVNCAYCHDTAKIEKKAGQDKAALQSGAQCAECHKK